ncbi:hypothetical protein [Actinoplanes couchii]|uniref:Uncharacterized protein n=1 Tax=Actinoplanes couchii TaxID=403638 RepID=A0ABQ3XE62_9ACTN|nr:hypothetical protein [Actinoplanes couchii]MDR6317285.1 hypothetical protein [Actinoplanes couchii]GID56779.1 hypothetical protein Aco03nite_051830 [Actinoplanes couchii]
MSSFHRLLVPFAAAVLIGGIGGAGIGAGPAEAHGFSSTVYADVAEEPDGRVRTTLELEYDLFVVSAADYRKDDGLFREGTAAFEAADTVAQAAALDGHATAAVGYVTERFTVAAGGEDCVPARAGGFGMGVREGVPYTRLILDWTCTGDGGHELRSTLFPASEDYVRDTTTRVTYALGGERGNATLTADEPALTVGGSSVLVVTMAVILLAGAVSIVVVGYRRRRSSVVRHQ